MSEEAKRFDRELGKLLQLHRMAKGMSREELASQMGLTAAQIERYETGSNRLSVMRYWTAMAILDQEPASVLGQLQARLSLQPMSADKAGSAEDFVSSNRGQQIVNSLAMCDRPEVLDALGDLILAIGLQSRARTSRLNYQRLISDIEAERSDTL